MEEARKRGRADMSRERAHDHRERALRVHDWNGNIYEAGGAVGGRGTTHIGGGDEGHPR